MIDRTLHLAFFLISIIAMAVAFPDKPYYDPQDVENLFRNYVKEYNKQYNSEEYSKRLEIFEASIKMINEKNAKFPGTVFKVNHFADWIPEELLGYREFKIDNETRIKVVIPDTPEDAPEELDYRKKGIVSHVKNQHHCKSCYIFSAIGNIEGQYAQKHNECIALSEQQAVDCLNVGRCHGGHAHKVMRAFAETAGVIKEDDYPYIGKPEECKEKADKAAVVVTGGIEIHIPDEEVLKKKLAEIGPLAVSLDAKDLHPYHKGILQPHLCQNVRHNHAVLLVGYGEENGTKFWILKNSWGAEWGEDGYFRLVRGINACGMGTTYTASSTVA